MIKSSVGSTGTKNVRINSGPAGSFPFVKNARVGRAPAAKVKINSALARSVTAKTMTLLPSTFSKSRVSVVNGHEAAHCLIGAQCVRFAPPQRGIMRLPIDQRLQCYGTNTKMRQKHDCQWKHISNQKQIVTELGPALHWRSHLSAGSSALGLTANSWGISFCMTEFP